MLQNQNNNDVTTQEPANISNQIQDMSILEASSPVGSSTNDNDENKFERKDIEPEQNNEVFSSQIMQISDNAHDSRITNSDTGESSTACDISQALSADKSDLASNDNSPPDANTEEGNLTPTPSICDSTPTLVSLVDQISVLKAEMESMGDYLAKAQSRIQANVNLMRSLEDKLVAISMSTESSDLKESKGLEAAVDQDASKAIADFDDAGDQTCVSFNSDNCTSSDNTPMISRENSSTDFCSDVTTVGDTNTMPENSA